MGTCSVSSRHSKEQVMPTACNCVVPDLEMQVLVHHIKLAPGNYRKWNTALE